MNRHRSDGADGDYGGVYNRVEGRRGRRFLSYRDLQERYGVSRVTVWRWWRAGLLPAPFAVGPNSIGFDAQEIEEHDANLKRAH